MRQADPGSRTPDPVGHHDPFIAQAVQHEEDGLITYARQGRTDVRQAHGRGCVVDHVVANPVLLAAAGPLGDDLPAEGAALPIRKLTNWTRD
jgi:hypothetical protein